VTDADDPETVRGVRFFRSDPLLPVEEVIGGVKGAQEASESMGSFIHVATVWFPSMLTFVLSLLSMLRLDPPFWLFPDRFLDDVVLLFFKWELSFLPVELPLLPDAVDGGMIASNPEEVPSTSLNATHSLLLFVATTIVET
jgi:hypothetical protein